MEGAMTTPKLSLSELEALSERAEDEGRPPFDTHSFTSTQKTGEYGVYRTVVLWAARDASGRHIAEFHREAEAREYVAMRNHMPTLLAIARAAQALNDDPWDMPLPSTCGPLFKALEGVEP